MIDQRPSSEILAMSDELAIPSRAANAEQFRQVLVAHGGPAFLRRAAEVNTAYDRLLEGCRKERRELLVMVELRLATLHTLAGSWDVVRSLLEDDTHLESLRGLYEELSPQLRCELSSTKSAPMLRQALAELILSIENFNRRWSRHVCSLDFGDINKLREGYNRFYVLEKECAVRSGQLARQGFRPLEMLESEHILTVLPLLGVPR